MELERTKNASRNIVFGCISKIYHVLVPFVMRTAMLYIMGVEYIGLNSLFVSILAVLNLAELGVGTAMVYSMYRPIVDNDVKKICALMNLYRKYYRLIGFVIAVGGLILLPFIDKLIKGTVPVGINLHIIYLLNLSTTVISYWLFAYKNSLLFAYQRNDISTKVSMLTTTFQYILQFCMIYFFHDYYWYLIVAMITQCLNNVITAKIVDIKFPAYKAEGELEKDEIRSINSKVKDLFTVKIGVIIVDYADNIVISGFLGLTMLAIYQNYFYIMNSVRSIISVVFGSVLAGIGNSIITETKKKNYEDFKKFTFIISWISCICSCCFLNMYHAFMNIWVGQNLQLEIGVVVLIVIYFYTQEISQVANTYKDAAGIWHKDRYRPIVTAGCNLLLNILWVHYIGIYGILLSTIISTVFIGMPWLLFNLFQDVFDEHKLKEYFFQLVNFGFLTAICCAVTYFICGFFELNDWIEFFFNGLVSVIVPNIIMVLALKNCYEFVDSLKLINRLCKGKLSSIVRLLS